MAFPFEDLEVYRRAIQFCSKLETILERPGVTRTIADQFSRATLSIPLRQINWIQKIFPSQLTTTFELGFLYP